MDEPWQLSHVSTQDGTQLLIVRAGPRGTERIVPPAGEDYAFDRDLWARKVTVSVSPKGRSVRVFVDDVEVRPDAAPPGGGE